jgi:hypothetical protein
MSKSTSDKLIRVALNFFYLFTRSDPGSSMKLKDDYFKRHNKLLNTRITRDIIDLAYLPKYKADQCFFVIFYKQHSKHPKQSTEER